jgi:hypothetical protein
MQRAYFKDLHPFYKFLTFQRLHKFLQIIFTARLPGNFSFLKENQKKREIFI